MRLKSAEVKFKTDSFFYSDVYFEQLNTPKSDRDSLFYISKNRV
ncbi:hypothetical protein [Epilithonimonas zeae]|nr:hypothetical protein [Epilithonimonas zeae]